MSTMGQSRHLMNQISLDLIHELQGGELRNRRYHFYFEKTESNTIHYSRKDLPYPDLTKILNRYADSIATGQKYLVKIFHDLYSSKVYAYTDTVIKFQGFPNFDNYLSSPRYASRFVERIYSELRRHQNEIDTLTRSDWQQPIYVFIDSRASHKVIKPNKLVKYLDSSLRIPWSRPMYHANPINAIAEIRLDRTFLKVDSGSLLTRRLHKPIQVSYVLPKQYGNEWVKFAQKQPDFSGGILVSFIFNPLTLKLENAVILEGDTEESTRLIAWIKELDLPENMFYWPGMPYATRTYFFIDAYLAKTLTAEAS